MSTEKNTVYRCDPITAFEAKIALFMEAHILPAIKPDKIQWLLSLSGGKDSYAMAIGLREWYRSRRIQFNAVAYTIDQWGGATHAAISKQVNWIEVRVIDGNAATRAATEYQPGAQAPCRKCSDVRRAFTDELLEVVGRDNDLIKVIARGLHLSDVATSLMWRYAVGRHPEKDMIRLNKARPLVLLKPGAFLAKPLHYAREYESQAYATAHAYQAACCGCPACKFPSRRDIVEETLLPFLSGPLWEFATPGMTALLSYYANDLIADKALALSAGGIQHKQGHLPPNFGRFAEEFFRARITSLSPGTIQQFDTDRDLDLIGMRRLREHAPLLDSKRIPVPTILRENGRELSDIEAMMIASLGPFWGAIGLTYESRRKAFEIQEKLLGFPVDEQWSQVNYLVREYYRQHAIALEHSDNLRPIRSLIRSSPSVRDLSGL